MATYLGMILGALVPTFIVAWLVRKAWTALRKSPAPLGPPHAISFVCCLALWSIGLTAIPDVFGATVVYGIPQLFWFAMDLRSRSRGKADELVGPAGAQK